MLALMDKKQKGGKQLQGVECEIDLEWISLDWLAKRLDVQDKTIKRAVIYHPTLVII